MTVTHRWAFIIVDPTVILQLPSLSSHLDDFFLPSFPSNLKYFFPILLANDSAFSFTEKMGTTRGECSQRLTTAFQHLSAHTHTQFCLPSCYWDELSVVLEPTPLLQISAPPHSRKSFQQSPLPHLPTSLTSPSQLNHSHLAQKHDTNSLLLKKKKKDFHCGKMKNFWKWMAVIVAQKCEGI